MNIKLGLLRWGHNPIVLRLLLFLLSLSSLFLLLLLSLMLMLFRQHQRLIWCCILWSSRWWVGGWGVNSNNHVKPNSVELSWGGVEVELGLWQLSFKCLNPTRRIFHICKPEVWCWKKGCDWHYLTCDNSIHWPLTSEGGCAGGSACGQVGGWVSLLDRLDERLGVQVLVGGGWWVKLGG